MANSEKLVCLDVASLPSGCFSTRKKALMSLCSLSLVCLEQAACSWCVASLRRVQEPLTSYII